jgi:hypothetical protein
LNERRFIVTIEERLTALEEKFDALTRGESPNERQKDWRRTIGVFDGDSLMEWIDEQALKYREEDRERSKREFDEAEGASVT